MYKHILSWLVVSTPLKNIVHICSYLAFPPNHPGKNSAKAKRCGSWPQTRRTWRSKRWSCRRLHIFAGPNGLKNDGNIGTCCSPPVRWGLLDFMSGGDHSKIRSCFWNLARLRPSSWMCKWYFWVGKLGIWSIYTLVFGMLWETLIKAQWFPNICFINTTVLRIIVAQFYANICIAYIIYHMHAYP